MIFIQTLSQSPCRSPGEDQIPIGIEELDCGAILEAVGAGEMGVGGDYPRPSEGAHYASSS
jgi:hypothetical protein